MTKNTADDREESPRATVQADGVVYEVVVPHHDTDYIQGSLMTTGQPYELGMLRAMREHLQPGDLVLDVGANIGNHSLYLATVAGCRVVAFEPNRELATALRTSVTLSAAPDAIEVRTHALGAASARGSLDNLDDANLGGQSVKVQVEGGDFDVLALDEVDLPGPVRAIKVDVEGMELDVLAGAEQLIARDRPDLYIEAIDGDAFDSLAAWVTAHDYCYDATYNATPTHRFRPGVPGERDLNITVMRLAREAYDLRNEALTMRRARDAASLRVRELQQQSRTDSQDRGARTSEIEELRAQLREARRRNRRLRRELAAERNSRAVGVVRLLGTARSPRTWPRLAVDLLGVARTRPAALPGAKGTRR